MKKGKIFITIVLVIMVAALFGCGSKKGKDTDATNNAGAEAPETEVTLDEAPKELIIADIIGYGKDEPLPVRLPDSDAFVYIEGATEFGIQEIDETFRNYEFGVIEEEKDVQTMARYMNGFNPEFNLVEAFQSETYDPEGALSWMILPLQKALLSGELADSLYYIKDGEDYRMSFAYYLIAVCYTRAWELPATQ